ncbi:MAG TPA: phosphoglycerate kinase [Terriglobales bacterium]|nr:phosphoglycerate kinase [Terriglobales bacterium]
MPKLSVADLDLSGRLVLTRVDFNVPMHQGVITDDSRITATLPTLRYLREHGARTVLCSHLGRPKGKIDLKYTLRPVAEHLERVLDANVGFCPETVGPLANEMASKLEPGGVMLVENLRFQAGEEANDEGFSRQLAELGDVYVNDAFGAAHRAHASTAGVTRFFTEAAAGFLMLRELDYLGRVLAAKEHPFVVILGGAKASDKLPLISHLARTADHLLIGGGMAYTFLRAQGKPIGDSLVQDDFVPAAGDLLKQAKHGQILLPTDHVLEEGTVVHEIPAHGKAMDIGPATRAAFARAIAPARIVFWNGPMGVFERPPLDAGTLAVARAVAGCPGVTVAGGGDSVAALRASGLEDKLTHVSTGGGASLEFLAGDTLPGVAALTEAPSA